MRKKIFNLVLVLSFTLIYAMASRAAVPPPPVNQFLGIPDSVFNNQVEGDCRGCHQPQTDNVNRHHLLINTPVPCPSSAPNADCTGTPTTPGNFGCVTCHTLAWDGSSYGFTPFRNCLLCHDQIAGQASVHHLTQAAKTLNCRACHGPIDNPGDHPIYPGIPTFGPLPGYGPGPNGSGGCAFCHDTPDRSINPGLDPASGVLVYNNADTHHSTGVALGPFTVENKTIDPKCNLCHEVLSAPIKSCEKCHGSSSLHNIQEHLDNCISCHTMHYSSASSVRSSAADPIIIIPNIASLSPSTITAGINTTITVTGSDFTNLDENNLLLTSKVVLTAPDGSLLILEPIEITASSMQVVIPATLAPGNYILRAAKVDKTSNPMNLSVTPAVIINSATCSSNVVTITGSGFSEYVNAVNSGTGVQVLGGSTCTVNLWSDTKIAANCGTCSGTVVVNSVFGTASKTVVDVTPKPCTYVYSEWLACRPDGTQSRTYTKSPDGCIENPLPMTTQTCTYIPPTCTSFGYSAWSACVNGKHTRTVISGSPAGCVGGNPLLTQTCNQPPVANAGPDKSASRNSSVKFDGSASKDLDGTITKYEWNFGDGTSGSGKVVYHKYTIRKTYTVTLKVTDNKGATATDTASVRIY